MRRAACAVTGAALLLSDGCSLSGPVRPVAHLAPRPPSPALTPAGLPTPQIPAPETLLQPFQILAGGSAPQPWMEPSRLRVLIATGDVIPARSVNFRMTALGDYLWPWRLVSDRLRSGDVTLINLETPLIPGCTATIEGMSFCGDARAVQGLVYGGVNVACMANNHSTNKGWGAYQSTQQLLTAYGIKPCGYDTVATTEIRGERFAFVAFNGVGQRFESEEIRRVIGIARQEADVVIASFHWGEEYVAFPSVAAGVAEDDPRQVARQAIDDGADLVIGNHPHWVQGIEIYHGHLITYAHGNFIFDQMWSMQTREGVVGRYVFYDRTLVAVSYWPLRIDDYGQPRWVDGPEAQSILNQMIESSRALAAIPAGAPPPAPTPTS